MCKENVSLTDGVHVSVLTKLIDPHPHCLSLVPRPAPVALQSRAPPPPLSSDFFSSCLPSHIHFPEFPEVCANVRKVWWTSLHSGRSPHDGGQRFSTLALTRKSDGLSYHCSAFCSLLCLVFRSLLLLSTYTSQIFPECVSM